MKVISVFLVILFMFSLLAACADNSRPEESTSVADASTSTSEPTPAPTPDETQSQDEATQPDTPVTDSSDAYPISDPIIPADLSSDPYSFQFALDGNILTLPALYSDFSALGFTFDDEIYEETLKPGFIMVGNISLKRGDATLSGVHFINLSDEELPLSECYVYAFSHFYDRRSSTSVSFVLPGGLHIGSTIDEIIAAYGEPTETEEKANGDQTVLHYNFSDDNYIRFQVDNVQPPYWNQIRISREDIENGS